MPIPRCQHRHATWVALALATAGCNLHPTVLVQGPERVVKTELGGAGATGALRELKISLPNGAPATGLTLLIDGHSFPVTNGKVELPDPIYQEAVKVGNLVIVASGYVSQRLDPQAALKGVTLSPVADLGGSSVGADGGKLSSADGRISLAVQRGAFSGDGTFLLGAYRPAESRDVTAARYAADLAKLYAARGLGTPPTSNCVAPFACLPVSSGVGVAIASDGLAATGTNGELTAQYDLKAMLHGWNGLGTPPWETGATGWTDQMKAEALAAAKILGTFQAMNTAGNTAWKDQMASTFGLKLDGTTLSFPVSPNADALTSGMSVVNVPGSELLGVNLEVTVTTSALNLPYGQGAKGGDLDPASIVLADGTTAKQVLDTVLPTADQTGATAEAARAEIALPGVKRPGSTLQTGLSLLTGAPAPTSTGLVATTTGALTGSSDPTKTAGLGQVGALAANVLTANVGVTILSHNASSLIANNAGSLIANNSGGLAGSDGDGDGGAIGGGGDTGAGVVANNAAGIMANNGSALVANNAGQLLTGAQLLSNNTASLIANNGGQLTGFPYLPIEPQLAKYELFQIGPPAPSWKRVTPKGLTEWLWEGLMVRAVDVEGNVLTNWVQTDGHGQFKLPVPDWVPEIFFLECSGYGDQVHAYSMVFSPAGQTTVAAVDSATSQMAVSTVELYNFIPPETARLTALAKKFKSAAKNAANAAKQTKSGSALNIQLTAQATMAAASQQQIEERIQELQTSWNAFNPLQFDQDRVTDIQVLDANTAIANAKEKNSVPIYNTLFSQSQSGENVQSLLPITLVSPF